MCPASLLKVIIIVIVEFVQFQCLASLAVNNLQSGLSSANLVASSTLTLWDGRSFFIVASEDTLPLAQYKSLTFLLVSLYFDIVFR